jgi:hypothetical protein
MIRFATLRLTVALLATALAFVAPGCGDDEEPVAPAPEKAAVAPAAPTDQADSEAIVQRVPKRRQPDPDAANMPTLREELRNEVARPDNFPSDAPVYPGSTTNQSLQLGNVLTVTFSTPDAPDEVSSFMNDEIESAGWGQIRTESMPASPGSMTYGFKPNRSISILVAPIEEGTPEAITMIMVRIEG